MEMEKNAVKEAFRDSLPVLAGYLVLGMGFGILMDSIGYGVLWVIAMSVFVYSGTMQYAAVGLFSSDASLLTVAVTTLIINARHLFYGIATIDTFKGAGLYRPYMIFALTDETYSLVYREGHSQRYRFFVSLFDHLYWIVGGALGSVIGSLLNLNAEGMDFSLTALFLTVFVDQWLNNKEGHKSALTGFGLSLISLLIFGADNFLIPAMLAITALLLVMRKGGDEAHVE